MARMNAQPPLAKHAKRWLNKIVAAKGKTCRDCGSEFRLLKGREIERCPICGDGAYDVYEIAEAAEDLP